MPLILLLVLLVVIGVIMWAVNTVLAPYMWAPITKIFNVVAIVATVVYVLFWFLGFFGIYYGDLLNFGAMRRR